MISAAAADRLMAWIDEAVGAGANYGLRAQRDGCLVSPAIVEGVSQTCALWRDEAFGPVAVVQRFDGIDEALALANDSPFGLQGAVFTSNLATAFRFADDFDVGSLWINEASRFRLDAYPFGGVKRSGFGREGFATRWRICRKSSSLASAPTSMNDPAAPRSRTRFAR